MNYFCPCGLLSAPGMTSECCLTFSLLILFAAVPKRRQYSFSNVIKGRKKIVYVFKVINTFRHFIAKALPITLFPVFTAPEQQCLFNLVSRKSGHSKHHVL